MGGSEGGVGLGVDRRRRRGVGVAFRAERETGQMGEGLSPT